MDGLVGCEEDCTVCLGVKFLNEFQIFYLILILHSYII